MNDILGNDFGGRVNMNLREDKHWSYGAYTTIINSVGPRPFLVYAPVETDKTKESLSELAKELRAIGTDRPATAAELSRVKTSETLRLPGSRETINQVRNSIENLIIYGLPDNYYDTYASKMREVSLADVAKAAAEVVEPDHMVWVVVGDRAKIEAGVRDLNLGEVRLLNPE
jgi:zinc protease